ncbi:MAG: hypothetical protein ACP5O7_10010 [Phycisphaerae bacterium]
MKRLHRRGVATQTHIGVFWRAKYLDKTMAYMDDIMTMSLTNMHSKHHTFLRIWPFYSRRKRALPPKRRA